METIKTGSLMKIAIVIVFMLVLVQARIRMRLSICNPGDTWRRTDAECEKECTCEDEGKIVCSPCVPLPGECQPLTYSTELRCTAPIPRWTFNRDNGMCESFMYGGCGGSANNFDSEESCKQRCHTH